MPKSSTIWEETISKCTLSAQTSFLTSRPGYPTTQLPTSTFLFECFMSISHSAHEKLNSIFFSSIIVYLSEWHYHQREPRDHSLSFSLYI